MRSLLQAGLLLMGMVGITAVGSGQAPQPTHGEVKWAEGYPKHGFQETGQRGEPESYIYALASATAESGFFNDAELVPNTQTCWLHLKSRDGNNGDDTFQLYPELIDTRLYRIGRESPGSPTATPPIPSKALVWDAHRRTGDYDLRIHVNFTVPNQRPRVLAPKVALTKIVTVTVPPPKK